MLVENLLTYVYPVASHFLALPRIPGRRDVASPERVGTDRTGTLGSMAHWFASQLSGSPVERALPAVVEERRGSEIDVLGDGRSTGPLVLGGDQRLPAVLVFHIGPLVVDEARDDLGGLGGDNYVPLAVFLPLEGRAALGSMAEFHSRASLVKVPEVECPKAANSHTALPEQEDDDVPKAGIIVLPETVEDGRGLFSGQNVAANLVVLVDLGDVDEFVKPDRDGLDGFTELDEVLDRPHMFRQVVGFTSSSRHSSNRAISSLSTSRILVIPRSSRYSRN